jgi:hypothetical protein
LKEDNPMNLTTMLMLSVAGTLLAQTNASSEVSDAKQKAATHRLPGERITDAQRKALAALGRDVSLAFSADEVPSYLMGLHSSRLIPQDTAAEAEAALRAYGAAFRMSAADGFVLSGIDADKSGLTHVRMSQTYQGDPVPDRELVVHMDADFVRGISGNFAPEYVPVDLGRESAAEGKSSGREAVAALIGPQPSNAFLNPGFESGTANWLGQNYTWVGGTYGGGYSKTPPICGGGTVTPARTGKYCACPGGNGRTSTEWIAQSLTIPSAAISGTLSFGLRIVTAEIPSPYDTLKIEIWNAAGTSRLATLPTTFANNSGYTSWRSVTMSFPLTYRGSTVQVRLSATEDSSNATTFYVDDLSLTFTGLSL